MPLELATLGESPSGHAPGVPYSPLYDDVYHAVAGAAQQARHVFLSGNGLPGRWQSRDRFVILETGFGLGNNFLNTWQAWRDDPQRCRHLWFVSIEKHPLSREDLARVHRQAAQGSPAPASGEETAGTPASLAERLIAAWPVLTPGLHTLTFDDELGQVTLLLGLGDIADLLPSLVLQADAFYLDGFAPAKNPQMWDEGLLSRLGRLAAPGATAATWSAARGVRDGLTRAGFVVERVPGFADKRDMVVARYEPHHLPAPPIGGFMPAPDPAHRHAVVIGAGLAGCAATWALRREGWQVTLIDRQGGPAQECSGNPGGLFHAIIHGEDGIHARTHRAAALSLAVAIRNALESGQIPGQMSGLLRLDGKTDAAQAQALLSKLGWPAELAQWMDKDQARASSGLDLAQGGWLFPLGGWLSPAHLAAYLLDAARSLAVPGLAADAPPGVHTIWNQTVTRLARTEAGWQVFGSGFGSDLDGNAGEESPVPLATASHVVLANASLVNGLTATLPESCAVEAMPLGRVRGQISVVSDSAQLAGAALPRIPVAGNGYVIDLGQGRLVCGSTMQHDDECPDIRTADHAHNLEQAQRIGAIPPGSPVDALAQHPGVSGRTGWRATLPDRMPVVGALPWSTPRLERDGGHKWRLDQPRMIPRERDAMSGLYVLSGLGSRGITWSILVGRLLAHWVTGAPCPVEADLRDAMDPARFMARRHSKNTA